MGLVCPPGFSLADLQSGKMQPNGNLRAPSFFPQPSHGMGSCEKEMGSLWDKEHPPAVLLGTHARGLRTTPAVIHQRSHKRRAHPHLPRHHCLWAASLPTAGERPSGTALPLAEERLAVAGVWESPPQNEPLLHPVLISALESLKEPCERALPRGLYDHLML